MAYSPIFNRSRHVPVVNPAGSYTLHPNAQLR